MLVMNLASCRASFLLLVMPVAMAMGQRRWVDAPMAGSEDERLLRARALLDDSVSAQWTVRALTPVELRPRMPQDAGTGWLSPVAPRVTYAINTAYPFGFNDGPVWSGRGLTLSASGGFHAKRGNLSVQLAPLAFVSQNASVDLIATGAPNAGAFAHWLYPTEIDLPQRFGNAAYGRIDLGESFFRWDGAYLSFGATSAAEVWGPALEYPIILGNNAGGIPRAFFGTSRPIGASWARAHGRMFWGRIDESPYTTSPDENGYHFGTGAVGSVQFPAGLEIGASRFFHAPWSGTSSLLKVFEGVLKNSLATTDNPTGNSSDNQLASVFMRWAPPRSGLEVYAEYGREDHNSDFRDLLKEPDHDAAYVLGLQRVWSRGTRTRVFSGEIMNSRLSHLQQVRPQAPWYIHSTFTTGHTLRGQLLGSAAGLGGGGSTIAYREYDRGRRTTLSYSRLMQAESRDATGLPDFDKADVLSVLTLERAQEVGRGELAGSVGVMKEFNRHFQRDSWNLNVAGSYRLRR